MTFGPDGALYVSNVGFGPPPNGLGQVLKITVPYSLRGGRAERHCQQQAAKGLSQSNVQRSTLNAWSPRGFTSTVYQGRTKEATRDKNHDFVQHGLQNPFVKGKQSSLLPN
jgi:hypothetical protein